MLKVYKKIWDFAQSEQANIKKSVVIGFLFAVFYMFQIAAIYFSLEAIVNKNQDPKYIWLSLLMMIISIGGRILCNYFSQLQQTHAGYFMAANKRIEIGNRLKSIPMGYFNETSLGNMTGITTSILEEIETTVPMILVMILSGFINSFVFLVYIFFFDARIGCIVLAGIIVYLIITSFMERKSAAIAPKRQASTSKMVEVLLEHVKGMFVVRSFNLNQVKNQKIDRAIEENRVSNLAMENLFTPYTIMQEVVLHLFSILIILASINFYFNKTMSLTYCMMMIIVSFLIFAQIQSAGSGLAIMRLAASSIDQANAIDKTPLLNEKGKSIHPNDHTIELEHVSFGYDKKTILSDISLTIPNRSSLAIVGPSGSGKSTLCHLIARFWDVNEGRILIGGHDVKEYTLESLMDQISMVFQNVYLFNDTIENNIKFGVPQATHEEVVKAAKQACCHDFISSLPNGYETLVSEAGSSLSGGERQRISIARAILKDAPIIIFDEASANVDPENEDKLQKAMEELMKDKTIIMIAHRLKTIKNASNIIVVDQGKIVASGTHKELLQKEGVYKDFINAKHTSENWKL